MENVGFANISNAFHDYRNLLLRPARFSKREWLKRSDAPTSPTGKYFNTVLPKFVIEHIVLCTHATHAMCVRKMDRLGIRIPD